MKMNVCTHLVKLGSLVLRDAVRIKAWGVKHSERSQHAAGESKTLLSQSQYVGLLPRFLVFKVLSFLIVL